MIYALTLLLILTYNAKTTNSLNQYEGECFQWDGGNSLALSTPHILSSLITVTGVSYVRNNLEKKMAPGHSIKMGANQNWMGRSHYLQGLSWGQLTDNSGCQPISQKLSRPLGFKSLVAIFHHGFAQLSIIWLHWGWKAALLWRVCLEFSRTTKWQSQHTDPHFHISPGC